MKQFWEDTKEYISDIMADAKSSIKMFGFWKALGYGVSSAFHKLIGRYVKNFYRLCQWIPVIWNDRDWDHSYFMQLLKYKLKRMQKELANGMAVEEHCKEKAGEIQYALDLIEKIEGQDLCSQEWAIHKMKYGELMFESETLPNGHSMAHTYYSKTLGLEDMNRQASEEAHKILQMEEQKRQAVYNELFMHIAKHIQGWWD